MYVAVLAEDAIKAALSDWKVKNQNPDPEGGAAAAASN